MHHSFTGYVCILPTKPTAETGPNPRRHPLVHDELFLSKNDAMEWAYFANADEPAADAVRWEVRPVEVSALRRYAGDLELVPEGAQIGAPRRLTDEDVIAIATAAITANPSTAFVACARATAINRGIKLANGGDEPSDDGPHELEIASMMEAIFNERCPGIDFNPADAAFYRSAAIAALRALGVIR